MRKKTFIPNWYVDEKNRIGNKKIKIGIVITSFLIIFLISLIFNTYNKINNINGEILNKKDDVITEDKNLTIEKIKNEEKIKNDKHNIITIEKYNNFSNFLDKNNLSYISIIITESNLEIDIAAKSYEEYIMIVRCIENNYSIKKLSPNIKNEGNFNFTVILEV